VQTKSEDLAYEFETIESKIADHICIAASETLTFNEPEFLQELDIECSKIKRAFKQQVVSFERDDLIKRYFHFHQESLIDLINSIQDNAHPCRAEFLELSILPRLSALLSYLEEHFPEYFDLDMKMPVSTHNHVKEEARLFTEMLTNKFQLTNIDIGLVELLKNSVDRTMRDQPISFRQYYYFRFLRITISDTNSSIASETIDVVTLLLHCNFNEDAFYQYMLKYINWSVNKAETIGDKIDQLAFYLKFANQEVSASRFAYNHLNVPINIQIADWITQEMQYLKHKQQLAPYTVNAEDAIATDFKLNFDLSVSILAYLFRTFTETGVIQNKNTSELIRFLTKYVKTKRSETISYESFRIKYYSVESGTKDAVKKMLQSVLNFINKN
jgi:hypothetical protein